MARYAADRLDRAILRALREDGRMSLVQLSDRVGLSPTPVKRRLRQLEDSGLIEGYVARIDRKTAGFGITAFVSVELEKQDAEAVASFQKKVAQFEEVVTGSLMTGAQDFLLEVVVESLEEAFGLAVEVVPYHDHRPAPLTGRGGAAMKAPCCATWPSATC